MVLWLVGRSRIAVTSPNFPSCFSEEKPHNSTRLAGSMFVLRSHWPVFIFICDDSVICFCITVVVFRVQFPVHIAHPLDILLIYTRERFISAFLYWFSERRFSFRHISRSRVDMLELKYFILVVLGLAITGECLFPSFEHFVRE